MTSAIATYERAALAAQKILADDGEAGRKIIAGVPSNPRIGRRWRRLWRASSARTPKNHSELVMGVWDGLTKSTSLENATNYAALILAREGKQEALTWLPGDSHRRHGARIRDSARWLVGTTQS
jgi:hypothetical protein